MNDYERQTSRQHDATRRKQMQGSCLVPEFTSRSLKDCKLDASAVPEVFRKEIEFYLTNGLNSKGIKVTFPAKHMQGRIL